MDYFRFQHALRLIEQKAAFRARSAAPGSTDAIDAQASGRTEDAEWWHGQALERLREGEHANALTTWQQALAVDTDDIAVIDRIGQGLRDAGHDPFAIAMRVWADPAHAPATRRRGFAKPAHPEGWQAACMHALAQDWHKALPILEAHLKNRTDSRCHARNLAFALEQLDDPGRAACVLASNMLARREAREAAEAFLAAPAASARSPEYLGRFICALRGADEESRGIAIAQAAAAESACPPDARMEWVDALLDLHRHDEAVAVLDQGAVAGQDWWPRLKAGFLIPPVPSSQEDMERMHQRAHGALLALDDVPLPIDADGLDDVVNALEPNFYLAYLGEPLVQESRALGRFVQRAMSAAFPGHHRTIPARRCGGPARIRIGYASRGTSNLGVAMRYLAGWLQHADRVGFELHMFPLEKQHDWMSGYLSSLVDRYHEPSTDVETASQRIRDAELDVLVYPEVGMDPLTMRLAALRLAPVQCVANGHPVSTGLDTLDYFISNDAMEPADAASHYSEQLVTLPGIGLCLPPSPLPQIAKSRVALGLPEDALVYLSAQSLFKYLPRHDEVFARIAQAVDDAVFVFVEGQYPAWTRTLRARLDASFAARELDPARHVRFIQRLDYEDFIHLNLASDVFLDPIGWSGGLTALDAISCDLPMAVLPGAMMRGRQSYGWLHQLGIEDTVAHDIDDYVRIAIRLGQDSAWRADVARRIREHRHLLFDDASCVESLEAFFRWAAGAARPGDEALFRRWPAPSTDPD